MITNNRKRYKSFKGVYKMSEIGGRIKKSHWSPDEGTNGEYRSYEGTYVNAYIHTRVEHDLEKKKVFLTITAFDDNENIFLDDYLVFDNVKKFKNRNAFIEYMRYLRLVVNLAVSDIRLNADTYWLFGPAGMVNCKSNRMYSKVEEHFYRNVKKGYRYEEKLDKWGYFLNKIIPENDLSCDVNSYIDDNEILSAQNLGKPRYRHTGFCKVPLSDRRRIRDNDSYYMTIDPNRYKTWGEDSVMYVPDPITSRNFALNRNRRLAMYIELLNHFLFTCDCNEKLCADTFKFDNHAPLK